MKRPSIDNGNGHRDVIPSLVGIRQLCNEFSDLAVNVFNIRTGRFLYCSPSFSSRFGIEPEILASGGWESWCLLAVAEDRPVVDEKFRIFFSDENPLTSEEEHPPFDYRVIRSDGARIHVRHEVFVRRMGGEMVAVSILHDNSERKRVERHMGLTQRTGPETDCSDPAQKISEREKEVLKMIASGLASRQIAKQLHISKHTVISHRKNLIEKFGVKNTAELIYEASKSIVL